MATIRPHMIGAPGYSVTLPRTAESARAARRLVRTALQTWTFGQPLIEDGELVVSELVANAVRHSGLRCIRVVVDRVGDQRVRIAVSDRSRKEPVPYEAIEDDEGGRGLFLVAAHAHAWGTEPRAWGKVVWAELSGWKDGAPTANGAEGAQ